MKVLFYNEEKDEYTENWEEATKYGKKTKDEFDTFMLSGIIQEKIKPITG